MLRGSRLCHSDDTPNRANFLQVGCKKNPQKFPFPRHFWSFSESLDGGGNHIGSQPCNPGEAWGTGPVAPVPASLLVRRELAKVPRTMMRSLPRLGRHGGRRRGQGEPETQNSLKLTNPPGGGGRIYAP